MTIAEIKRQHVGHFFDKGALRFFNSTVCGKIFGRYFVTSERFDCNSPKFYTVRRLEEDGNIETIGDFQGYASLRAAQKAAEELSKG